MAVIINDESNMLLSGTSDADTIYNGNYSNTFIGHKIGRYYNGKDKVTIDAGTGNDFITRECW